MLKPIKLFPFNADKTYLFSNGSILAEEGKTLEKFIKEEKTSPLSSKYDDRELPFIVSATVGSDGRFIDNGSDRFYFVLESDGGKVINGFSTDGANKISSGCSIDDSSFNSYQVKNGDFLNVGVSTPYSIGKGVSCIEVYSKNSSLSVFDFEKTSSYANRLKSTPHLKKPAFHSQHEGFSVRVMSATSSFTVAQISVAGEYSNKISAVNFAYLFILDGACEFKFTDGKLKMKAGDSYLLPSGMGDYSISGPVEMLYFTK